MSEFPSVPDPNSGSIFSRTNPPELLVIVKEFMNNNEELPASVMEDLQKGIAKPPQELADLDEEIDELERRSTQLKIKRQQIQEYLSQYDCLLSPIRRLPTDILHSIFHHCLPTRRDPIMSATEAPILLTHICRAWRQIAYSSPTLWARLYITFSDEDALVDSGQISYGLTKQNISDTLRLRCAAVKEWLSRSGACPLSISLSYTSRIRSTTEGQSPGRSDNTLTLFRTLTQFCARWRRLELRMPLEVYRILEDMIQTSELSMLDSVRISLHRQLNRLVDGSDKDSAIVLFQAPNLQRIALSSIGLQFNANHINSTLLTSLSPNRILFVQDGIDLLRKCPNLEYAMLILKSETALPQVISPQVGDGRIYLPRLRALCIADAMHSNPIGSRIYELIDAPNLEWLDYSKDLVYEQVDPIYHTAVVTLLQKSTRLRKLTIKVPGLYTPQLRKILRNAQSITQLVFGPEVRTDKNLVGWTPGTMVSVTTGPRLWDLGDLFLRDEEGEVERHSGLPLLPCLEILEVSQESSLSITDEGIRDIILHRVDLHTKFHNIVLLRKVGVIFSRAKERDITKDLSAHSQNAGKVELFLKYFDVPRTKTLHYVYSRYGIDKFDRSWQHRDIEEEVCFPFFIAGFVYLTYDMDSLYLHRFKLAVKRSTLRPESEVS